MIQRFITKWKANKLQAKKKSECDFKAKTSRQKLAEQGEAFARKYLKKLGWTVEGQNWRSGRFSEIDIIARDKTGTLVFVEVKSRRLNGNEVGFMSSGFDSIDERKRRKITTGALHYLAKHNLAQEKYRFDAIVLYYLASPQVDLSLPPEVNHVQGIF